VIAATKSNLETASEAGEFREDLYYRLNIAELHIPNLADRYEDVPLLFDHYANKAAYQFEREYLPLAEEEITTLMNFPWKGNVRQLKNMAERYILGVGPTRNVQTLLGQPSHSGDTPHTNNGLAERVHQFETVVISRSLRKHKGNVTQVMEELQLPRRTLNNKMSQYGIKRKDVI